MGPHYWIGIDPATHCGWAVLDQQGGRSNSGVWSLERRAGDGAGMLYVRFSRLFNELLDVYPGTQVVGYEQQVNRFPGAAQIGAGIVSHIQRICEERAVPYTGCTFSAVKKLATGKGNASKGQMVDAATLRWFPGMAPLLTLTDDEADALWVGEFVRSGAA